MRTYEPWPNRRAQPRVVSLDVARALQRDAVAARQASETAQREAQAAQREAQAARREARAAQRQVAEAHEAADTARREADTARREADTARQQLQHTQQQLQHAQREAEQLREALAEPSPQPPDDERLARLSADLANVRRHQVEAVRRAHRDGLAQGLLTSADVADGVRRALDTVSDDATLTDGLHRLLRQIASGMAVADAQLLGTPDEPFDPTRHEAVGTAPGPIPDRIAAVVRSGVALSDGTVLRPAQVIVTQTPEQS